MKTCILRGVPPSLRQDGWWLGPITHTGPGPDQPHAAQNPRRYALHALLLAGLIAVAQMPGLAEPGAAPVTACGGPDNLGFHAATGLRSLAAVPQRGTPL